ncbi:DUF4062 domain-containing protein [Undibacterium oligocarboniphilum]|uniref:DUF4062 domain-containing protein n=1 Tax=Undibacterium oligocarboniphilum TaxID=666702 RepID=A0A850QNH5_9BURK|nr:DUF4062 domain-containing protein [Undibacterium oligocarboniphilum]MBC3869566.1 DUF4062 domain-containing protein [Undibacterium oligocarboniphilum]NVO77944.1 DUF4062 domain-containing protein [Undibacterium oligocarboniphilum]
MTQSVFVSSTPFDLALHRQTIMDALSQPQSGLPPLKVIMALPETALDERLRLVRNAMVYVVVLGMVRGNTEAAGTRSLVQLEFEEAQQYSVPTLIYLMDEDEHLVLPKHVDTGAAAQQLADWKAALSQKQHVRFFHSAADLAARLQNDLHLLLQPVLTETAPAPSAGGAPAAPASKTATSAAPAPAASAPVSGMKARRYALTPPRFAFFKEKVSPLLEQKETPVSDAVLQEALEFILAGNSMAAASGLNRGSTLGLEDAIELVRKMELIIIDTVQRHQVKK